MLLFKSNKEVNETQTKYKHVSEIIGQLKNNINGIFQYIKLIIFGEKNLYLDNTFASTLLRRNT